MVRSKVVQEFNSVDDKIISEIHSITDEKYGDYHWLYKPQESDKLLLIKEDNEILAFCLYSLVDQENIDQYSYTNYKEDVEKDSLIINHIIVRSQHQRKGLGREIMDHLFEEHDETILCKAWVPDDKNKNKFFEKMGFTPLEYRQNPWNHIDFRCLGCGSKNGCVCSGVVYVKNNCV